jgi:hypothetical protein
MKKIAFIALASLLAVGSASAAELATLSEIEGTALVNQGEEFVTATEAQVLLPGDQVMVMEGGKARIQFADGCVFPIESGSLVVVPEQSTCAGAVAKTQRVGAQYAQAVGEVDEGPTPLAQGLIIGAVMIGIIAAVNEGPVSP